MVRRIEGPVKKGFHRVAWDLRFPATSAIGTPGGFFDNEPTGVMAAPGEYNVTLSKEVDGVITDLSEPMPFMVERMRKGALEGAEPTETATFWQEIARLQQATTAASLALENTLKKLDKLQTALSRTTSAPGNLDGELHQLRKAVLALDEKLNGNHSKRQVGEKYNPTIEDRLGVAITGTAFSTYGPTPTHERSLEIAAKQFRELKIELENILNEQLPALERKLKDAGAPWIEGQPIPEYE